MTTLLARRRCLEHRPLDEAEPAGASQEPETATARPNARGPLIPQPHGGALLPPPPPGSNGGVHRGPDLRPRINVVAGTWMKALMDEGQVVVLTRDKKGKPKLVFDKGPDRSASRAENLVTRLRAILDRS